MTTLLHPCLQTCSIYDATESYGQILMEGPDTETFLHRLTSNDVKSLEIKKGLYNSLLTHKGKVQSLFYLYRVSSELFIIFVLKLFWKRH
ncbi:MAG: hypothetical protein IPJ69_00185 [Deltaproteobacteria bacterium]|nr:MAG: hypothetical protein IPJ69_00185 [Deltaproteobacteria bacterium]